MCILIGKNLLIIHYCVACTICNFQPIACAFVMYMQPISISSFVIWDFDILD